MTECQITNIPPDVLANSLKPLWVLGGILLLAWIIVHHTLLLARTRSAGRKLGGGYAIILIMHTVLVLAYVLAWVFRDYVIMLIY